MDNCSLNGVNKSRIQESESDSITIWELIRNICVLLIIYRRCGKMLKITSR